VPGLTADIVSGRATAVRRVLGARRAGRYGFAATLLGVAICAPFTALGGLVAAHGLLSLLAWRLQRPSAHERLSVRECQRLLLWTLAPALIAAAPLRLLVPESAVPAAIALIAAHALAWRAQQRGFAAIEGRSAPGTRPS
jgi:hypothetical protein